VGQQQLLLVVLGVTITGIAIVVGTLLFSAQSIEANKEAIITDLQAIAAHSYQYITRPKYMAGGGGQYNGYYLPRKMTTTDNAFYDVGTPTGTSLIITATSQQNEDNKIIATIGSNGRLTGFSFIGDFE
jgi:hypothetical protein